MKWAVSVHLNALDSFIKSIIFIKQEAKTFKSVRIRFWFWGFNSDPKTDLYDCK